MENNDKKTDSNSNTSSNSNNHKGVKIIPLGGVEEIGINCTVIEQDGQIIVIDAGLGFSDIDHLGVDYLIPNYDYLVQNRDKVEAIFITHGHLDHIGAISHFLEKLNFPDVFATQFAMELIKVRLEEAKILDKAKLHVITPDSVLKSKNMQVKFFRVTHSIPESLGILVETSAGTIAHSGDFKFDNTPLNEPKSEYHKMTTAAEKGVRVLLSDSTNSFREGHSISENQIMGNLEDIISGAKGRVIVATFASLVTRLYALTEIAKRQNRKIFLTGRSMQQSFDIARKLNYIKADDDLFTDSRNFRKLADERQMILATGSQGEYMAALSRMARGEHRDVKIQKGDTVILSSSIIPGNDLLVQNLIDDISQLGAKVIHQDIMNVHTSGHGFQEDQKWMINILKPEVFIPVHGYQYFLHKHADTAIATGIDPENVITPRRGDIIEITEKSWKINGRVKNNPILISGAGVGDVGPILLQDREQLGKHGIVVINLVVTQEENKFRLLNKPTVISRGFVFMKESKDLIDEIIQKTESLFNQYKSLAKKDFFTKLRFETDKVLSKLLFEKLEREPLIFTNIETVSVSDFGKSQKENKSQDKDKDRDKGKDKNNSTDKSKDQDKNDSTGNE